MIFSYTVAFLDFTFELFTTAIYLIELIVGELTPLLFHLSFNALPISFNPVPVHRCLLFPG
jgi:hypothetical protein